MRKHKVCYEIEENCHPKPISLLCETYGKDSVSGGSVFQWHKKFSERRKGEEKSEQLDCPITFKSDENV
jgi:hypothetical protein